MKRSIYYVCVTCILWTTTVSAQVQSTASMLTARERTDVVVPFRVLDEGVETPIKWGLDLQWLSEENIHRGTNYAGKDLIDIIRTGYKPSESVENGVLSNAQIDAISKRSNIIKRYAKSDVGINIASDHGESEVASWYNVYSIGSTGRGKRWAQVIDLSIKKYAELGVNNIVSISAYNEPDYGWGQGYSNSTRKSDFLNTIKSLKEDYEGAYDGIKFCGGNTLNCDMAYEWWNYLKAYLDEGNTHQLAGTMDNYASFFQKVRSYNHEAVADELHNTMEAMVGVEYGMQTGIWWGTCEHTRSQFMKATYHGNPGKRLGYGEHRSNWTSASVYRHVDGSMQAFGGTSERQAVTTTYNLASLDRPVWFNGLPGREYVMTLPGGTGYQTGQTNAETVVDVQSDADIMPHIDGTYKIMNVNSGLLMGFASSPSEWTSVTQRRNNNTQKFMQWIVSPIAATSMGDLSYYTITLNTDKGMQLDILDWNMYAGASVGAYAGGLGTNEQWYLVYAGKGAFYIRSRFSTKCLAVKGGSKYVSAKIEMADFTGEASQQWRFVPVGVTPELNAPNAPSNLQTRGQASSIRLDWTASSSNDVDHYVVLRSEDGTDFYTIANQVTSTAFVDNESADGVEYSYRIYAVDKCLNYSEPTEAVTGFSTSERACVMQLPFESTLNDTTANGNHAAMYGSVSYVDGEVDHNAIALSGSRNFIQLPYTVANHDEITIACWLYWKGGSNWQRAWDFGTGTSQYLFFSPRSDSGMRFAIKNGGDEQQIRTTSLLSTNKWVHVTVSLGAEGGTLYVDGEAIASNSSINIKPSDIQPIFNYIGRSQFSADPYFKGYVDDFRVYNYALSADEVKAIANHTDGIDDISDRESASIQLQKEIVYDLQGRPVPGRNAKGVVVKKGKKYRQ